MSEYINNSEKRKEAIKEILKQISAGTPVESVTAEFARVVNTADYSEIVEAEQALIQDGTPVEEIQNLCDLHVAVFRKSLDLQTPPESTPGHPVFIFRAENQALEHILINLETDLNRYLNSPDPAKKEVLKAQLQTLVLFDRHFLRKEHLLFSYLEKYNFTGPSRVMWGIHDQIRALWKQLRSLLDVTPLPSAELRAAWESISQIMKDMVYKENNILFPAALEKLSAEEWVQISAQSTEYGYFLVTPGSSWQPTEEKDLEPSMVTPLKPDPDSLPQEMLPLSTGGLTVEQINLMLTGLPVDITFVDENDTVRYFSQTRERIFDRSPAIIGRKVQNCHPPKSLKAVERIIEDFKADKRRVAEFWIQMGGKFVHIRYFALRDAEGAYRGTIEVSQEVSGIRALEGEKRLES